MRRKGREFLSWGLRKKGTKKGNEQPSDETSSLHLYLPIEDDEEQLLVELTLLKV